MAKAPASKVAMSNKAIATKSGNDGADKAVALIEKKYGLGSIMTFSDAVVKCEVINSGEPTLNLALGVGGIPRGRVIEIYGPESSGKTTLTLQIIAEAQKAGGRAAFIDAEHALDPSWAKRIGVKIDELLISQPDTAEQALDICEILVRGGNLSVIVIDSVAALTPRAELEGEMGDSHIGLQARLMSQALRKLTGIVSKSNTTVIFINQIREKIGVMFGNPETTAGGKALKFYASIRLDIKRISAVKIGEVAVGNKVKIRVVKNKVAPPFREAEATIYFGDPVAGFDKFSSILELAATNGILEKSGSWYAFKTIRLGNGFAAAAAFLRENTDLYEEIWTLLWEKVKPKTVRSATPDEAGFDEDPDLIDAEVVKTPSPADILAQPPVQKVIEDQQVEEEDDVEVVE